MLIFLNCSGLGRIFFMIAIFSHINFMAQLWLTVETFFGSIHFLFSTAIFWLWALKKCKIDAQHKKCDSLSSINFHFTASDRKIYLKHRERVKENDDEHIHNCMQLNSMVLSRYVFFLFHCCHQKRSEGSSSFFLLLMMLLNWFINVFECSYCRFFTRDNFFPTSTTTTHSFCHENQQVLFFRFFFCHQKASQKPIKKMPEINLSVLLSSSSVSSSSWSKIRAHIKEIEKITFIRSGHFAGLFAMKLKLMLEWQTNTQWNDFFRLLYFREKCVRHWAETSSKNFLFISVLKIISVQYKFPFVWERNNVRI